MHKAHFLYSLFLLCVVAQAAQSSSAPLRIGVVGLAHGHVAGFFHNALKRTDVQILGIAEPDRTLFDRYSREYSIDPKLYFSSVEEMIDRVHPEAVVVYTSTFDHLAAVQKCAARHVHVMMEKPLAVSYAAALAMKKAAEAGNVHVLVNYETTWYASNAAVFNLVKQGALGETRKVVVHDGHRGPKEIGVQPEFLAFLTDPKLNGAGALYDFGCYGADLMTVLMRGQAPRTVTAVTQQFKPEIYPKVDDEANVILTYPSSVAILEPSWNWPFDIKDMIVYGSTGSAKTILRDQVEVRRKGESKAQTVTADPLTPPQNDSLQYLSAVVRGEIQENNDLSSLNTNIIVSEILDAARQSAQSGKTVSLPLRSAD